jgi:hypothetical protein
MAFCDVVAPCGHLPLVAPLNCWLKWELLCCIVLYFDHHPLRACQTYAKQVQLEAIVRDVRGA